MVRETFETYSITESTQIYNMDEIGFSLNETCSWTVTKKGIKDALALAAGPRDHISIIATIRADGFSLPPYFIFKGNSVGIKSEGAIQGFEYSYTKSGFLNEDVWIEWANFFIKNIPKESRNRVLFMDGFRCHTKNLQVLQLLAKNNIIAVVLPGHTSSSLQPLDVGVFSPLKNYTRTKMGKRILANPLNKVSKRDFPSFVAGPWKQAMTLLNIVSAFKKSGLWPVDEMAIKANQSFRNFSIKDKFDSYTDKEKKDVMDRYHLDVCTKRINEVQKILCLPEKHNVSLPQAPFVANTKEKLKEKEEKERNLQHVTSKKEEENERLRILKAQLYCLKIIDDVKEK